jgi:Fe-S-cluster containining protein
MTPDLILLEQADDADLPAGEFSDWLTGMARALDGRGESDVPCGDCDACCRSGYFIELKPTDDAARRRIPAVLLFDAPGAPRGYQVLGHDEAGRCPMLEAAGCAIYADRPLTCRTYDCRIFAATGIAEAAAEKSAVTARARRWRFSYRDDESRALHQSLRLGTGVLRALQQGEGASDLPRTITQLALLAVQLHEHFHALAALLNRDDESVKATVRAQVLDAARGMIRPVRMPVR